MKLPLFALILSVVLAPTIFGQADGRDMPLSIAVRAEVDRPFQGWGKAPVKDHGRVYMIATIGEAAAQLRLVQPVNEEEMLTKLREQLARRGYREAAPEGKPELVLTILYGRGYIQNPYLDGAMPLDMANPPSVSITGATLAKLISRRQAGFEAKLQNANHEKLFIRVTAWDHPHNQPMPKKGTRKKPYELWHTLILVDDPANRDLNPLVDKMLTEGSKYFDSEIEDEEAIIDTNLPEGSIHFGESTVVASRNGDEK